jgi:hypothetical protein
LTDWSRLYGDLLFSPFDAGQPVLSGDGIPRRRFAINQQKIEFSPASRR